VLHSFQILSVWLTTVMLLTQAVCPILASDCGCSSSGMSRVSLQELNNCHCATSSNACPHCQGRTGNSEPGCEEDSVCHCADQTPTKPELPAVPETPNSCLQLNLLSANVGCFTATPVLNIVPAHSQVPSNEVLTSHFKQVVYCVWLT